MTFKMIEAVLNLFKFYDFVAVVYLGASGWLKLLLDCHRRWFRHWELGFAFQLVELGQQQTAFHNMKTAYFSYPHPPIQLFSSCLVSGVDLHYLINLCNHSNLYCGQRNPFLCLNAQSLRHFYLVRISSELHCASLHAELIDPVLSHMLLSAQESLVDLLLTLLSLSFELAQVY